MIQLYLGGESELGLLHSHTNHNTEKRALAWATTSSDQLGSPAAWNWKEVTRISSRLNRFIRRITETKAGSRPVLPESARLLSDGVNAL